MSTRPSYLVTSLDDIEEIPAVEGTMRWKPLRRTLGIGAFGVNAYAADTGQQVVEDHDETGSGAGGHEELYVVMRGHARFTLDGDDVEAPAGTLVFAKDPAVRRGARATQDGTLVLAVGSDPVAPYTVPPWETWFLADARSKAGDHDAAIAIMRADEPRFSGNPVFHYNFACFLTAAGRLEEAGAELRHAREGDPEKVTHWAANDPDLDPLRDHPSWPLG